jgi:glutamate dehydrogenase
MDLHAEPLHSETLRAAPVGALRRLVDLATERYPDEPLLAEFLLLYFAEVHDAEVDERDLDDVLEVAAAHFRLGHVRRLGRTVARVLPPSEGHDGTRRDRSVLLVVTDDAPFLVDTTRMVLERHQLGIHFLVHPMLDVARTVDDTGSGEVVGFGATHADGAPERDDDVVDVRRGALVTTEAWTQIEIDRCDPSSAERIQAEVVAAINDVHRVVRDFPSMRARMAELADIDPLLGWLAGEHLVFLGAASHVPAEDGGRRLLPGTGFGLLLDPTTAAWAHPDPLDRPGSPAVVVSRTDAVSSIHRPARMTCVDVRDEDGVHHRFVGLLASSVYRQSVLTIPSVGSRARAVLGLADAGPETHTGRSMRNVLETLPRDLVLELDADHLARLVIDIVGLQERQVVRIFEVPEPIGPWSTVLVYLPRSRFDAQVPARVAAAVAAAYGTTTRDVESFVGASSLARITLTVRRPDHDVPVDLEALVALIDRTTMSWDEAVRDVLVERVEDAALRRRLARIAAAAPADYRTVETADGVVEDLMAIADRADVGERELATGLRHDVGAPADEWRFRVYRRGRPTALSEVLPLLDHLGLRALDERPYEFDIDGERVYLYDIGVRLPPGLHFEPELRAEVLATFEALVAGDVEADDFNRLVALAGLTARQASVLRAYAKYLRQIGFAFSQAYVEETLARLPNVAQQLVELFGSKFDPAGSIDPAAHEASAVEARSRLAATIDEIEVLDEDRICRAFLALIDATVRTNAYRDRPAISFKFDPARIPDLPLPRPAHEIFVCSPRVEGVHLRAGDIARGGLRWSDRREDFRTEVLGLVKAQMVKNAVIVPVGAKGGFVVKQPPPDPTQLREEVTESYRTFVRGMLDVTDNVVAGHVVKPDDTVVYDGDDPYLVVAADKGTATFSDVANGIAAEYGFWLGDAFASGGSVGYDHKAMGITARGAWESVRRHGRVIGKDVDRDPITVVGIGDMSGDVFGNGMLRSRFLRLVAAFDHRHIFLDPDADSETSFAERQRLFDLPRSSWADYDRTLISRGGGVHSRAAKSIAITPEVRAALGIAATQLTPIELVRAILAAPVDLLWNGGIGTYVKASTESNADVGDRANDAVRLDGSELRCRIVAEGGNLGFTQRGRIEYAIGGGLINTDAIDNSAGVDCSDHEVNIKILLDDVVAEGGMTVEERNALLAEMTDEVAELVLGHNRAQTLALMIARRQALSMVNVHARYLDVLEAEGWLDRGLECLPADKQIAERQTTGSGLQTPEFAVLMAYTKNADVTEVLRSDFPDDPALDAHLLAYFPAPLQERFADHIRHHRLHREIVTTKIVDEMVNLSGISFDHRMTEDTGASVVDVLRGWVAAREILGATSWWSRIDALDRDVGLDTLLDLFLECRRVTERSALWLLRHRRPPLDVASSVARFRAGIDELSEAMDDVLVGRMADVVHSVEAGRIALHVPEDLAQRSAIWPVLHTGFDMIEVADLHVCTVTDVAAAYWSVFESLDLMWLWEAIGALPRSDRWQTQARSSMRDDLLTELSELASTVIATAGGSVSRWFAANERSIARATSMIKDIRRAERLDISTLSVALRQLHNLSLTSVRPA